MTKELICGIGMGILIILAGIALGLALVEVIDKPKECVVALRLK